MHSSDGIVNLNMRYLQRSTGSGLTTNKCSKSVNLPDGVPNFKTRTSKYSLTWTGKCIKWLNTKDTRHCRSTHSPFKDLSVQSFLKTSSRCCQFVGVAVKWDWMHLNISFVHILRNWRKHAKEKSNSQAIPFENTIILPSNLQLLVSEDGKFNLRWNILRVWIWLWPYTPIQNVKNLFRLFFKSLHHVHKLFCYTWLPSRRSLVVAIERWNI